MLSKCVNVDVKLTKHLIHLLNPIFHFVFASLFLNYYTLQIVLYTFLINRTRKFSSIKKKMVVCFCYHLPLDPSMATKPFVTRADHPIAPDLSADRSIFHRGSSSFSSSSGRRDLVFVVNPRGSFLVS